MIHHICGLCSREVRHSWLDRSTYLEIVTPDRSSFLSIYLGTSFMKAPCKQKIWSLQTPSDTVPTPPPAFKTRPSSRFPERVSLPHFVVFAFVREVSSPLPTIVFQFCRPARRMESGPDENPNVSTTPANSH
ncbi:hypothetical protein AVEN_24048-1 [Araneus ventricosus]|uniref:Uncharacterized protein n=1 Tax=Araneus ventricosus TaxID=182803 RepID=A0A4Y2X357_ARAVE|nr:hypothetical protein AVEN_24048-1 [Araneus ventricosus]